MIQKISLKLNNDVLLTVIKILENTDLYLVKNITDAFVISCKEELISLLANRAKSVQIQVSILDHNKKQSLTLKFHQGYTLFKLLEFAEKQNQTKDKKVNKIITDLANKLNIDQFAIDKTQVNNNSVDSIIPYTVAIEPISKELPTDLTELSPEKTSQDSKLDTFSNHESTPTLEQDAKQAFISMSEVKLDLFEQNTNNALTRTIESLDQHLQETSSDKELNLFNLDLEEKAAPLQGTQVEVQNIINPLLDLVEDTQVIKQEQTHQKDTDFKKNTKSKAKKILKTISKDDDNKSGQISLF